MEASMKLRDAHSRRELLKAAAAGALLSAVPFTASVVWAQNRKPKLGMIGSGNVGSALGGALAKKGYEVMFSSRNLESDKKLAARVGTNARAGTSAEAAAFREVLV